MALRKIFVIISILILLTSAITVNAGTTIEFKNLNHKENEISEIFENAIFVDDDSPYPGNGSFNWPYSNITYAVENASENDTIIVCNGVYYENIIVDKRINLIGSFDDIIGNDKDGSIIDGRNQRIRLFYIKHDSVKLKDFIIVNGTRGIQIDASYTEITGNKIINNYEGIHIWGTYHDNIISSNEVINSEEDGLTLRNGCYNNTFINNIFTKNKMTALSIHIANSNNFIGNHVLKNGVGFFLGDSSYNVIAGNIVEDNDMTGIYLSQSCNNTFNKNYIKNNRNKGIYIRYNSDNNKITNNNFEGNYPFPAAMWDATKNYWNHNYWNRPRILPKPILQLKSIGSTQMPFWYFHLKNVDWHPAIKPNEIGGI